MSGGRRNGHPEGPLARALGLDLVRRPGDPPDAAPPVPEVPAAPLGPPMPAWVQPGAALAFTLTGRPAPLVVHCTAVHVSSSEVEIEEFPGRFAWRLFNLHPASADSEEAVPARAREGPRIDQACTHGFRALVAETITAAELAEPPAGIERLWIDYNAAADELWLDGVPYAAAEFRAFAAALGEDYRHARAYVYPSLFPLPADAIELRLRLARCLADMRIQILACHVCAGSGTAAGYPCARCLSTRQLLEKGGAL